MRKAFKNTDLIMKTIEFNKRGFHGHGRNKYLENGTVCKESEDVLFKLIHLF